MKHNMTHDTRRFRLLAGMLALMILGCMGLGAALAADVEAQSISLEDAKAIALEKAGFAEDQVLMTLLKEEWEDGSLLYEVEFIAGGQEHEYEIDAATGEVLKASTEKLGSKKAEFAKGQYLTLAEVKAMALEKAGLTEAQGTWTELELDQEDGRAVYELTLTDGAQVYEVELDASTGDLLKFETKAVRKAD